jgi:hypothetical protein
MVQRTREHIYAFGNASGPRLPRLGIDMIADAEGRVGPGDPPTGGSCFIDPERTGLSGHYHRLRAGTILPVGLAVYADGADVGGTAPWGHRTIYPVVLMSFEHFAVLWGGLPWEYAGKKKP